MSCTVEKLTKDGCELRAHIVQDRPHNDRPKVERKHPNCPQHCQVTFLPCAPGIQICMYSTQKLAELSATKCLALKTDCSQKDEESSKPHLEGIVRHNYPEP